MTELNKNKKLDTDMNTELNKKLDTNMNTELNKNKTLGTDMNKLLKKWVHYEENIKNLEQQIHNLKLKKNKITPLLEEEFKNKHIHKIMVNSNYYVELKNKEYYSPVNRKFILKSLKQIIDDTEKQEKIIDYIYNNRDIIYRKKLLILPK
tara:strand:- start:459 stop:908 length:450 start_codon:yes stop_codon:yes gene_type:complete